MSEHTCHARGCSTPVRPELLMCGRHWRLVPRNVQSVVYETYRAGQCDDKRPSAEWHEAASAAIGYVAQLEKQKFSVAEARAMAKFNVAPKHVLDGLTTIDARKPKPALLAPPARLTLPAVADAGPTYDPRAHGALCDACPLNRQKPVPPASPRSGKLRLVIIGEGPGRLEERLQAPFVGPSGKTLNGYLRESKFSRDNAYVTNAFACLEGRTRVRMADGSSMRINQIVKLRHPGPVLTVEKDGSVGQRAITNWYRNERAGRATYRVSHEFAKGNINGVVGSLMTEDHPVLTEDGWLPAAQVNGKMIATGEWAPGGHARDIAIGSFLGDGCIPQSTGRLVVAHSIKQQEYAALKAQALGAPLILRPHYSYQLGKRTVALATSASIYFRAARKRFYRKGHKAFPKELIGALSDLTLAIWFMDDGYFVYRPQKKPRRLRKRKGDNHTAYFDRPYFGVSEICIADFRRSDGVRAVEALRKKGLDCTLTRTGRPLRILFGAKATYELGRRIAKFVPPSMQYKIHPDHRGRFDGSFYKAAPRVVFYAKGRAERVRSDPGNRVYCIDVDKTHNFMTTAATVHNCRIDTDDADIYTRATVCCAPRLAREVATIPKDVPILTLGKSATRSVLGTNGIMKARGFVWTAPDVPERKLNALKRLIERKYARSPAKRAVAQAALTLLQARATYAGRTVLPSVHPAHVLRNELWGPILSIDIDRAIRFVKARESGTELPLRDEARYEIARTPYQLETKLTRLFKRESKIVVDIETTSADPLTCEITCIGIGSLVDPGRVLVAWPWHPAMAPALARFTKNRVAVGHNIISFDEPALKRFGIMFRDVEDTLIAQHSFASHMPKSLAQVVSQFTDARPWKIIHRGQADEKGLSAFDIENENLPVYNCLMSNVPVVLADGRAMPIDEIVNRKLQVRVLSLGPNGIEKKRVIGWSKSVVEGQKWHRIRTAENGRTGKRGLITTPDHRIYTERGLIEASEVRVGDKIAQHERAFDKDERSAILGTLLGDSSLAASPLYRGREEEAPTIELYGSHTDESGHAQMKVRALRGFIQLGRLQIYKTSGFGNGKPTRWYRTGMTSRLNEFYPLIWVNGKRRLLPEVIEQLGPIGWAWWFMDDGCRQNVQPGRRDMIHLAVCRYPRADQEMVLEYIREHFGPASLHAGSYHFSATASAKFCEYVAPYVFPKQRYKLSKQARWPAYQRGPLSTHNEPFYQTVVTSEPFDPLVRSRTAASRKQAAHAARTRYCLTVEDNHNFFTTFGLVHNSSDVSVSAYAYLGMQNDLEPELHVYEHDKDLARVCRDMQAAGMAMDTAQRDFLSAKLGKRADALLGKMRTLTKNRRFDPNKATDIRKALYGRFHQPVLELTTKTHQPSTAIGTLQALREREGTKAGELADLIIRRRSALKSKSSFVDGPELGDDGRVHWAWRSFGAVTGRMSARGVVQLLPRYAEARCNACYKELPRFPESGKCPRCKARLEWSYEDMTRSMFVAAPGRVWVYFDLAQSEMRAASWISNDEEFIRSCESGDVHTANAKILFPEYASVIESDPKGVGKEFRDITKNAGFAVLYRAEVEKLYATLVDKGFPVELSTCHRMLGHVHRKYRGYYKYCDEQLEFCRENGFLRTELLGRIRWFGRFPKPTETANFKVQSFIADLMNERLIAMWKRGWFGANGNGARLVAQIHDAVITEVPEVDAELWKSRIKEIWAEPVTIPRTGRSFTMPVDLKVGTRWSELG